ncbi:hypothetical protein VKT23_008479 [Stygiomarasmius scandens]|uniref:F-box domain-containing protein n=1 Tax=Marasmiellus scandens TaxID=2682957 RepID=A0ABR1JHL6_9AGAR
MPSVVSLPTEIVQEIGAGICKLDDKKNLRATCFRLSVALAPQIFSEISLEINRNAFDCGLHLLETLAAQNALCNYVRTLRIDSLSPSFYPDPNFMTRKVYTSYLLDHARQARIEDERGCDRIKAAQLKMEKFLYPALASLCNLRVLKWNWHWTDGSSTLEDVMTAVSSLDLLEEFHFCYIPDPGIYAQDECQLPLPDLKNLRVISITVPEDPEISWKCQAPKLTDRPLARFVKHLITHSPHVSKLCLDNSRSHIRLEKRLNDLLEELLPLPLHQLTLGGWKISMTDAMRGQFRTLTSLELLHCTHFNPDLWPFLQEERVHLKRLTTDNVSDSLLDYLSSYSGLVHLSLTGPTWYTSYNYHDLADRFFDIVLPLHGETLRSLEILPSFEGRWCFEENNYIAIGKCSNLTNLSVKVNCVNMPLMDEREGDIVWPGAYHAFRLTTTHNPVHFLLYSIHASSLSQSLTSLHIDAARSASMVNSMPDAYFGPGYRIGGRRRIRKSAETFSSSLVGSTFGSSLGDASMIEVEALFDVIQVFVAGELCVVGCERK